MAWIDDRIWCHPKFVGLTPAAFSVWVKGVAYASGWSTKGQLGAGAQELFGGTPKVRRELIDAGLWIDAGKGDVVIHDWDDHNSRRDEKRTLAKERKRRSRINTDGGTLSERDWIAARRRVFDRDEGVCIDCGKIDERWHADHVPDRETLRDQGIDLCDIDHIETRCASCHGKRTNLRSSADKQADKVADSREGGRAPDDGSDGSDGSAEAKAVRKTSSSAHSESLTAQPFVAFLVDESTRLGVPLPNRSKGQAAKLIADLVNAGANEDTLRMGITRMIERGRPISALTDIVREVAVAPAAEPEVDYPPLPIYEPWQ